MVFRDWKNDLRWEFRLDLLWKGWEIHLTMKVDWTVEWLMKISFKLGQTTQNAIKFNPLGLVNISMLACYIVSCFSIFHWFIERSFWWATIILTSSLKYCKSSMQAEPLNPLRSVFRIDLKPSYIKAFDVWRWNICVKSVTHVWSLQSHLGGKEGERKSVFIVSKVVLVVLGGCLRLMGAPTLL